MKINIYIDKEDLEALYNNLKNNSNDIIDYDHDSTMTHNVLITLDYEDFVRLKDNNLLIEY